MIAERIESLRLQLELARDPGRLLQRKKTLEALSHLAAETRGSPLGRERFEQILTRLAIRAADLVALSAKSEGRHGHADGQYHGRRCGDGGCSGDETIAAAPAPGSFCAADLPRDDRPSVQEPPQVLAECLGGFIALAGSF